MIKHWFYTGNYQDVIRLTIDAQPSKQPVEAMVYIIGALAFRGRLEHAEDLFAKHATDMSLEDNIAARFFLGVNYCRVSEYRASRFYFGANLRQLRESSSTAKFYIYQGLGFYRYFRGHYHKAHITAQRAWNEANASGFLFGKTLSADLAGYCFMAIGKVRAGIAHFDQAIDFASQLGNGSLRQSLEISKVTALAKFGISPAQTIENLQKLFDTITPQDNYSKSLLLLELARQHYLRGRCSKARTYLDQACEVVYAFKHRRFGAQLSFRYSYLHYLAGEKHQAINLLRSAIQELDVNIDHGLELEIRGLEQRVCKDIGIDYDDSRLKYLTRHSRTSLATTVIQRNGGSRLRHRSIGEDPLGDLKDQVALNGKSAVGEVIRQGYLLFLFDLPGIRSDEKALHFGLCIGHPIIVDFGNVETLDRKSSKKFQEIFVRLAEGWATKEDLVKTIWGYEYSPLRHDSLIYTTVSRMRQVLGSRAHWIQNTEGYYSLAAGVKVRSHYKNSASEPARDGDADLHHLNDRQRVLLSHVQTHGSVSVRSCSTLFDVSDMTLRRDLADLVDRSYFSRIGNARTTRYVLRMEK